MPGAAIDHPALMPGRVAVITGGAHGIGLACATRLARAGLRIVIADISGLDEAAERVSAAGAPDVLAEHLDVSDAGAMCAFKDTVFSRMGDVGLLMNNAAIGGGGNAFSNPEGWSRLLSVNLMGVVNGTQAFAPAMLNQAKPAVIVNTGSKQGITSPPGDTAYNVSKAAIKVLTEGLAHSLREIDGGQVTAHLLIPGFTYTTMIERHMPQRPAAAWLPEQVADAMVAGVLAGNFYILCADNETPRAVDERRILWAAGDIIENRPALSRWHEDYKAAFAAFMGGNER